MHKNLHFHDQVHLQFRYESIFSNGCQKDLIENVGCRPLVKHKTQKVANLKLVHYFLHDHNNFQFSIVDGVVAYA